MPGRFQGSLTALIVFQSIYILSTPLEILKSNIFYMKIIDQYKGQSSSLAAEGIQNQFANYDGSAIGAGYYGEEGHQIIYYILITLFDQNKFNLLKFQRVSWDTLLQQLVLPEMVTQLIQEDLCVTRKEAIITLTESNAFGKLMHPGDDHSRLRAVQNKVADMFGCVRHNLLEGQKEPKLFVDLGDKGKVRDTRGAKLEENNNSEIIFLDSLNTTIEDGHKVYILDNSDSD
ncbi:hypothetical protein QCA50_006367 [Cerrena zonata]|uniref:Restriction of telomere capping protein 4 C-terminal domain-containing protein n=1 Tax=Cerrena zonata TaxID=2478898 RepID=A0AAW0G8H4_9APHY